MAQPETRVSRVYEQIRKMAERFEFKPESQINEVELALKLGTSRTPVREALNRLVAEGFLTFQSRRGFFCRALRPAQILSLYEARIAIECEALRIGLQKATDEDLSALVQRLRALEPEYDTCTDPSRLLDLDEMFHTEITALAQNPELTQILANLNGRIRFVRLIDLTKKIRTDPEEDGHIGNHRKILSHLESRDIQAATETLRKHIERRRDQAVEAVARAFAEIYGND